MSKNRIEKWEAGRKKKTKVTKSSPSTSGPLQLLSIVKGLYQACGLAVSGSVEHLSIPTLPPWGQKICEQLRITIFKRFVDLNPRQGPVEWRNFGRILGVGLRELGFIEHELVEHNLAGQNSFADELRGLDEMAASLLNGNQVEALLARCGESFENSLRIGLGQAPAEQYEFLTGLAEGQVLFLDTQGQLVGDRGRTAIYFELLSRWVEIEAMRKTIPQRTLLDVYRIIAPTLGDTRLERQEWFFDVCDDIALSMKEKKLPH